MSDKITYRVPSRINETMGRKNRMRSAIIRLHEEHKVTPSELIDLFGYMAERILNDHYGIIDYSEGHDDDE